MIGGKIPGGKITEEEMLDDLDRRFDHIFYKEADANVKKEFPANSLRHIRDRSLGGGREGCGAYHLQPLGWAQDQRRLCGTRRLRQVGDLALPVLQIPRPGPQRTSISLSTIF